jgi:methylated-DNA-[protein]-cysteine S-methyltransferase
MKDYCLFYNSPIGYLKLTSDESSLRSIEFVDKAEGFDSLPAPEILKKAEVQLKEYFEGRRFSFSLDINPEGTSFQKQVWQLVQFVGFGITKNYNDIAMELGSTKFCRAVGMANGKNPLPVIIPCHRIIGANGKLVGYSGGLERKKWLLLHEQKWSGKVLF